MMNEYSHPIKMENFHQGYVGNQSISGLLTKTRGEKESMSDSVVAENVCNCGAISKLEKVRS